MGRLRRGHPITARGLPLGTRDPVFPATGIGAGALVGIAMVEVAREQTTAGVGDAQRTMHEHLQRDIRAGVTNLRNLRKRQFSRQDHARHALLLPEAHSGGIRGVGLHRQVNFQFRPTLTHQHDQPWIGHDQRIRRQLRHGRHIVKEGPQLGAMGHDVGGQVETPTLCVGQRDAGGQIVEIKIVVAHPKAVTRHAGIHRIGPVGQRITEVLQRAGGG